MRTRFRPTLILLVAVTWVFTHRSASASRITQNQFGPGAIVESFEGLATYGGANIYHPIQNLLLPGVEGPYTFASGATLVTPDLRTTSPDVPFRTNSVLLIDNSLITDGRAGIVSVSFQQSNIKPNSWNIPDGQAYLVSSPSNALTFQFASDLGKVGAFVSGSGSLITLSAFDAQGQLLESVAIPTVLAWDWPTNFLGLEAAGIRKVVFSGESVTIDALRFEPVPEPSTLLAWGASIVVVLLKVRRRRLA